MDLFSGLLKFIKNNLLYHLTKTVTCTSPVVLSDLWKDSSLWKVDFSKRAVFSKVREYNREQTDYILCVNISESILFENIKQILTSLNDWTYIFSIENIRRHIWKPCTYTFSSCVISTCLGIRALSLNSQKHLVEAEKLTFQGELSFQRS